jgi:hypothetical protein
MYALVAYGYQLYYGSFGLTPSDVGIKQTDIVAQTAVAVAFVGSVVLFLSLLLSITSRAVVKYTTSKLARWLILDPPRKF